MFISLATTQRDQQGLKRPEGVRGTFPKFRENFSFVIR